MIVKAFFSHVIFSLWSRSAPTGAGLRCMGETRPSRALFPGFPEAVLSHGVRRFGPALPKANFGVFLARLTSIRGQFPYPKREWGERINRSPHFFSRLGS